MENKLKACLDEYFNDNEGVIFIGSGFSKNLGMPTWQEFAYDHLNILEKNKIINYETSELLKKENFRTVISATKHHIDKDENLKKIFEKRYKELFQIDFDNNYRLLLEEKMRKITNLNELITNDIYEEVHNYREKNMRLEQVKSEEKIFKCLYNLGLINVTTNYDDILDVLAKSENKILTEPEYDKLEKEKKVFYTEADFKEITRDSIKGGQVYHIHGSVKDINTMIISNEDYIKRYWTGDNAYKKFLKIIFENHNVIFIGYSLQELEILNYLFEKENNIVNRTDKKRILIMDSYEYEHEKIEFLSSYYKSNYNIDLCCYNKSVKGYKEIDNVVKIINEIRNEKIRKKESIKICSDLIGKSELISAEKETLINNLKENHDMQISFFKKINGIYDEWYLLLVKHKYFEDEHTNLLGLLRYINSIYFKVEKIDTEVINRLYSRILKKQNDYLVVIQSLEFVARYNSKIINFDFRKLTNILFDNKNRTSLIVNFIDMLNQQWSYDFFKENNKEILRFILHSIFIDNRIIYEFLQSQKLIDYFVNNEKNYFINTILKFYERNYVESEFSKENTMKVKYIDYNLLKFTINNKHTTVKFNNLKDLDENLNKEKDNIGMDLNEIKMLVKGVFNKDSYTCIFDSNYLIENEKIKLLINLAEIENIRNDLIKLLFESKIYLLKKLAIYLIIKYDMLNYLISKINEESFDFEYIVRNAEFDGELRHLLEYINNCNSIANIKQENLIRIINKGRYINYKEFDKKDYDVWRYERLRELKKFHLLKLEFDNLKKNVEHDYKLSPMIGETSVGWIEYKSSIDTEKAKNMTLDDWINHINTFFYNETNTGEVFVEYNIQEDIKLLIKSLKSNIDIFMCRIEKLSEIKNSDGIYYIFEKLNNLIEDKKNDFSEYYIDILNLVNKYLDKLDDIYEEPKKYSYSKKHILQNICLLLKNILLRVEVFSDDIKVEYKNTIDRIELKISDRDDFKDIFSGSEISYINNCINSIHYYILQLEITLCLKLKEIDKDKEYITKLLIERKKKSRKEFLMVLGEKLYSFLKIDEELTEEFIREIISDEDKEMFLSGFAYCRIINKKGYELIKNIMQSFDKKVFKDKAVAGHIIEYYTLAYLLGYNNDLNILKNKRNLHRGAIFNIFKLKDSCKKLNSDYNEEEYNK